MRVNGAEVQAFEFADEAARREVSDTISESGSQIGTSMVDWIDQPNLWATGRLIVLYIGQDQAIIDLITHVLGDPITIAGAADELTARVQAWLAEYLNVPVTQVTLVTIERAQWSDACLGLGRRMKAVFSCGPPAPSSGRAIV